MTKSTLWIIAAIAAGLAVTGCDDKKSSGAATATASATTAPAKSEVDNLIDDSHVGHVRLGMERSELEAIEGVTVEELPNDRGVVALSVRDAKQNEEAEEPEVVAEMVDGSVAVIRVDGDTFRTAEGAGAGTAAKELENLYGEPGNMMRIGAVEEGVQRGEGFCAEFEKAPGSLFCFSDDAWKYGLWQDLVDAEEKVAHIYVFAPEEGTANREAPAK